MSLLDPFDGVSSAGMSTRSQPWISVIYYLDVRAVRSELDFEKFFPE